MAGAEPFEPLERLIELEAIREPKARRDHAVNCKDWDTNA